MKIPYKIAEKYMFTTLKRSFKDRTIGMGTCYRCGETFSLGYITNKKGHAAVLDNWDTVLVPHHLKQNHIKIYQNIMARLHLYDILQSTLQ